MLISIGILAWNEEGLIGDTLASLLKQSVFGERDREFPEMEWEIIVVPNGCSDRTAAVALEALAALVGNASQDRVKFSVHEIAEAGKSNAWNRCVHDFCSEHASFIVLMDADIEFAERETIANTVKALIAEPSAAVAVDLPLKDVVRKPRKTLIERVSALGSEFTLTGSPGICGQYYCARAEVLRRIWMPKGLSGEDGFLRAMVVTDCFRAPVDDSKVIRAARASHYYETLTSLRAIFRHELRLVIGIATTCYLTWDFLRFATDPKGPGAGELIRNRVEADPDWYGKVIANTVRNKGYWVLPRGMLIRRFSSMKEGRGGSSARWWLVAIAGFVLDLPVLVAANRRLKQKHVIGYW